MALSPDELRARLTQLLERRPEVLEAYLFGSRAQGRGQPHSDVDVAVYAAPLPEAPFGYAAELAADLMSGLGENRVDVVLLHRAPPLLYHRVLRDGVRLFARDLRATTAREGAALSRYCDYRLQLVKIDRALAARVDRSEFGR
ncbi:MAG TPA: nucleotidyltransferase domain-containing protein [Anaeromyxobacter sp.]|nr:nucleotidyltransferase domain-containing protein [Anaeromyxobacter sp.]